MSKLKKIVSVILAVTMLMTVAPVSMFASAYAPSYTHGTAPSYTYTEYYVDTTGTDNVIRVGNSSNPLLEGTTIVAATPSGIPDITGATLASAAYAGETPELPDVEIIFVGKQPSSVTTPTASASSGSCSVSVGSVTGPTKVTVDGKEGYKYSWKVNSGGTASVGTDIIWTINYKMGGDETFQAYAYMHVEKTLMQSGYHIMGARDWYNAWPPGTRRCYLSATFTIQGRNVYNGGFGSGTTVTDGSSGWNKGYINYNSSSVGSGDDYVGLGASAEGSWSTDATAVGAYLMPGGSMVSFYASGNDDCNPVQNSTGTDIFLKEDNSNRPRALAYLDIRRDKGNVENLNLRQVYMLADAGNNDAHGFHSNWVYTSNTSNPSSWTSVTTPSDFTTTGTIKLNNSGTASTTAIGSGNTQLIYNRGDWMEIYFKSSFTTTGYKDYAIVTQPFAEVNGYSNNTWATAGMAMAFEVYNTTDLYNVYMGILKGTGFCNTTMHASDTVTFNKGANPRSDMYSSGWGDFNREMQEAGRLLQTPDTNQTAVNAATSELISAYEALVLAYEPTVEVKVNHYISGTTTEVAPAQWITVSATDSTHAAVPAGATATGYALTSVSAYALVGTQTTKTLYIDGKTNPAEITFFYTPQTYTIIVYANNDINNDGVADSNDTVRYEGISYNQEVSITSDVDAAMGTKQYYQIEGYYTDAEFKNKLSNPFTMPASNLSVYVKWVTTPLHLYVDSQIEGQDLIDMGSVSPNEDATVAVEFAKPETDPSVEGYIFTGYYADAELTTALTWPQYFYLGETDRTVYGRFVDVNGKIIFESNGGTNVADQAFVAGETVIQAPEAPTKEGYTFAGWYKDKECENEPVEWGVTMPDNTGFVAYAKWTPERHKIKFNLNNPDPTPYDTQSIPYREGYSDSEFKTEDIPNPPRRFGYVFDRWMYNDGTGAKNYTFSKYPTKDIELVAIWRAVDNSAFVGIEAYEKLSGEYKTLYDAQTNPDGAKIQAGDIVTFRMTSLANFYVGSSLFVFMYDKDFFEFVDGKATMFSLNSENEYVSGINATFTEVTDSSLLEARWPDSISTAMNDYAAMQIAIDPTVTADDYTVAPMQDGEWLIEFQLKVKDTATGSGTVYMDNAWTRTGENPMGTMFYGWAENSTDAVFNTTNNTVTPDLTNATATIVLDDTTPVETTVQLNAAPGSFADGETKTYTGRAETEIIGYVDPTREGYKLTGWENDDENSAYTSWDSGYYAKAGYGDPVIFNAVWDALQFPADFYMKKDGAHYKQVQVLFDDPVTAPDAPTMQGYVFAGWSTDGVTVLDDLGTMDTTEGKKYYAVWDPATDTPYTVTAYVLAEKTDAYKTYSYTGTTDSTVQIVETMPETPVDGVTYITVESIEADLEFYILDTDNKDNALPMEATITPDGKLNFNLYFKGRPVTVTFDADGGQFTNGAGQYLSVGNYNELIVAPTETPTKYGYDFVEWADFSDDFTYYEDETFYASWSPVITNIQFMAEDANGNWVEVDVVETEFGKSPKAPTAPEKAGYVFKGWKETADGTDYVTTLPAVDKINDVTTGIAKTYYAHYELAVINVIYKVTYADGTVETKYTDAYRMNDAVTIRAAETLTGHTFSGWKLADGSDAADFTMGSEEVVITGTFTANTIGVVFNANGGTFADGKEETTVDTVFNTTINLPAEPSRTGYTFKGWVDTPPTEDVTSGSTSLGTLTKESATYYAVWEAKTVDYYIDIYVMDTTGAYPATPETTTATAKVGSDVTYTAADKTGFTIASDSVLSGTIPAPVDGAALHIVVNYQRNQWNLITTMDGETVDTVPYYYEQTVAEPEEPVKEGHSFGGWTPEVPETMPNNDVTLIATMNPNNYNVTYDYAGGTYQGAASTTLSKTFGTVIPASDIATDAIVYEGHTFSHWINAATGEKVEFTDTTPTVPVNGITLQAVYTVNEYVVTYSNKGTTVTTFEVPYGTTIADIKANYAPGEDLKPTLEGNTFVDWNWDAIGATMPARNVTVLALWDPNTYTITFNENGGSAVTDIQVDYGELTNFTGTTTKTGYTFSHWYLDDENTAFTVPAQMPALDVLYGSDTIELNAKWNVKSYTITFDSKGGSEVEQIKADYNADITAPANPERTGYTFDWWYLTDENTKFEIGTKMPALDELYGASEITLNAKWTVKSITITFDSNEGSAVDPITANYGDYITNRPADPTREGYTFKGWTLDGVAYTIPEYMEHDEDVTVVAGWEKNQYTINFNSNGGSTVEAITAYYGDPITVPADPTREGYTFKHWYYKNTAEAYDFGTTMPALDVKHNISAKSITLTAYWEINQYTITFDTAGGSAINPISGDYGTAVNKPADPTRDGYEFVKWDTEIPGTIPAKNMTITAIWEANEYTIKFEENGGTEVTDITKAYETEVTEPTDPTRTGYTFQYWYEDGSEDTAYVFDKMPLGGTTLYAKWDANEYTISINANGGTKADGSAITNIVQDFGTAVTDPGTPVKAGNTFQGWYVVGTDTKYEFPETMPAENVSIEARWTVNYYDVIFYNYDGTEYNKTSCEFGDEITAAPDGEPVREHYTFVGWSLTNDTTDDETETPIDFAAAGITVEVNGNKFYPIFKRVPVTLELITGSSARVTTDGAEDPITGYIYGIATKTNTTKLTEKYLAVKGDGELRITPTKYNLCGTGTKVEVYDNVEQMVVEIYYVVIFGDLNGDSAVDTIDVSMLLNETAGNTIWSQTTNLDGTANNDFTYYRVLAADINGDGRIDDTDSSCLKSVTLYAATIKQEVELTTDTKMVYPG